MSGVVVVLGNVSESTEMLERAQAASAGRGAVGAQFLDQHCHVLYQGENAAKEFFCSPDWLCCALGWPYEMQSGEAKALSAELLAERFARQQVLNQASIFGQYLIVLYCCRTARLWVLRDALGSLPFHWSSASALTVHASDIRQIHAALNRQAVLCVDALKMYHQNLALPNDVPLYQGVQQHIPGQLSVCSRDSIPLVVAHAPSLAELVPGFATRVDVSTELPKAVVLDAIATSLRMCVQDRAFALSLSGGMDSALIALSLAKADLGTRCTALACIFPGRQCDESEPIKKLLTHLNFNHELIPLLHPHFDYWQRELFEGSDYVPFPANQIILNAARCAARKGISVLIDGNGGDELFDWNVLELAQCARSGSDVVQVLRSALGKPERTSLLACKHLLGRFLRRGWPNPKNSVQSLAQKMVSASRNRAFYLAREQLCANEGVQVFSPLRDTRLLRLFAPYLPSISFHDGVRRGFQARCIASLSGERIRLQRVDKVSFNDLTLLCDADSAKTMSVPTTYQAPRASTLALPDLGPPKLQHYSQLLPRFFRHKVEIEHAAWIH